MPWVKPESDEYEYRCIEWRGFQENEAREQIELLLADGWELDGTEDVKAGMSVDLYFQQLKRLKA